MFSCKGKSGIDYVLIPWKVNGVEAYWQLNDFKKAGKLKYVFPKGYKKLVYGIDQVDPAWPRIIVFEGVYDSLFVKNGVAVGTKAITSYQLSLIRERWPRHQITVAFDNDEAGWEATQKLIQRNSQFSYLMWAKPGAVEKDVNDFVLATGDVRAFSDPVKLESMVANKLVAKMDMLKAGLWKSARR